MKSPVSLKSGALPLELFKARSHAHGNIMNAVPLPAREILRFGNLIVMIPDCRFDVNTCPSPTLT